MQDVYTLHFGICAWEYHVRIDPEWLPNLTSHQIVACPWTNGVNTACYWGGGEAVRQNAWGKLQYFYLFPPSHRTLDCSDHLWRMLAILQACVQWVKRGVQKVRIRVTYLACITPPDPHLLCPTSPPDSSSNPHYSLSPDSSANLPVLIAAAQQWPGFCSLQLKAPVELGLHEREREKMVSSDFTHWECKTWDTPLFSIEADEEFWRS